MTAFVRKAAEDAVLREDWHENEDGSRLLLSHKNYEKLVRAGARFTVMNKTRLLAVTVNPFSAKGSHYNKTEFYDAMCSGLGGRVPVLDVVSEFGCEAAE